MVLPIIGYGNSILRKDSVDIDVNYPNLDQLIRDMWETLEKTEGVGLSAPQVGQNINLFVVDSKEFKSEFDNIPNFRKVFINPTIIESGKDWELSEGCLSIPGIREKVIRPYNVKIEYLDENFIKHEESYKGIISRIIQHEYDHLRGTLFIDRLNNFRRHLLQNKLKQVSRGKYQPNYPIIYK